MASEDKMLMEEVLNNTSGTSAEAEQTCMPPNRPAICGSTLTGALWHHPHDHLVHLVVHLDQADFGDAMDMVALTTEDRWLLPPLCFFQLHCQLALGLFSFLTACCA